jgi:hypothetical protein
VECDAFTRGWFQDNLRLEQGKAQGYPSDQVDGYRTKFGLSSALGEDSGWFG